MGLDKACQGSKLALTNSQNASDFDKLQMRKISTSERLRIRIIDISQTFTENLLVVYTNLLVEKILLAKRCKWTEKLTLSPAVPSKTHAKYLLQRIRSWF